MNVLAIDTSHPRGSASISIGGRGESLRLEGASSHLTGLSIATSRLLSSAGVGIGDLDRVAIVTGPGSFTGLRVGMAFVKGLYAARAFDVVVMTSLELLALQAEGEGLAVAPMIDARKNEVYAALYLPSPPAGGTGGAGSRSDHRRGLVEKLAPCVVSPQRLIESIERSKTLFVGSGALRYRVQVEREFGAAAHFAEEGRDVPDTWLLCRLAERLTPIGAGEVVTLEPFYVRPDDATLKPLKGVCAYDRT